MKKNTPTSAAVRSIKEVEEAAQMREWARRNGSATDLKRANARLAAVKAEAVAAIANLRRAAPSPALKAPMRPAPYGDPNGANAKNARLRYERDKKAYDAQRRAKTQADIDRIVKKPAKKAASGKSSLAGWKKTKAFTMVPTTFLPSGRPDPESIYISQPIWAHKSGEIYVGEMPTEENLKKSRGNGPYASGASGYSSKKKTGKK